jgi:amino acid adenylation domain-containing protein
MEENHLKTNFTHEDTTLTSLSKITPTNFFTFFKKDAIYQSISQRFEDQVALFPNNIALKIQNQELTYIQLNSLANCIAKTILLKTTITSEAISLLLDDNNISIIISIIAVLKACKIYVPLNPTYPKIRLAYILQDTKTKLLITDTKNLTLAKQLANQEIKIINIDEINMHFNSSNLGNSADHNTSAYILYTSGSTGKPKGILQTHRNILHFIMNYTNGLHICSTDRLSLVSSCSFSASVMDIFAAFLNGATLFPFNLKEITLIELSKLLISQKISVFHAVPTIFRHIFGSLDKDVLFITLRIIDLGGEPVRQSDIELFKKHCNPDCLLVNGYGCTELNVVRQFFINYNSQIKNSLVPVGYPVEDTEVMLLNEKDEKLGINQIGEIIIVSDYLTPGYWNNEEMNKSAFNHLTNNTQKRYFRTGDLGLFLKNNCLIHLGRKDFQIKIRGYRIEPTEIELALLKLPIIKEAVVVGRENVEEEKYLIAYIVITIEKPPTVTFFHKYLQEKLPSYMLPSVFVVVSSLPLTATGKVDRLKLPDPNNERPYLENSYIQPTGSDEIILSDIISQVIKFKKVGIHDNFFELGVNSLIATQIVSRIKDIFQIDISLIDLFNSPTIAGLLSVIQQNPNLGKIDLK